MTYRFTSIDSTLPPNVILAEEDNSVNFVRSTSGGMLEARYVRRTDEYFIAYVSSQTGCDRACRFCHLTASRQTDTDVAAVADYLTQLQDVLDHHVQQDVRPTRMNINFMARGEPFLNPMLHSASSWSAFQQRVVKKARKAGISNVLFNISTIMPEQADTRLSNTLWDPNITLYYSLYSLNEAFRKRWLPKALNPFMALTRLREWQKDTGNKIVLHWAFIEGENDDDQTLDDIIKTVKAFDLDVRFNAVRYNPYSPTKGREPSEDVLEHCFRKFADAFGDPHSRIVPRVGYSAKASCGMFVE